MTRLLTEWPHDIAVAGAFLTRLPFRPKGPASMDALANAARAFPIIGLLVGGLAGGALWLATQADLYTLPSVIIGLIVAAIVTGALHEDGLADLADGMGARSREHRLEIMRDSRIGAFGVLALIFSIALKAALLAGLPGPGLAWGAMVGAAVLSRAIMPLCMLMLAPARADGLAQGAGRPDSLVVAQSLGLGAVAAVALFGWNMGLAAIIAALLAFVVVGWLARSRLGGYTGDVLGAMQQVAEVFILIVVGAILP
jgi:adenosylcobinamide-GDP ribazoletransferase